MFLLYFKSCLELLDNILFYGMPVNSCKYIKNRWTFAIQLCSEKKSNPGVILYLLDDIVAMSEFTYLID
jgi:hypothetical protein